MDWERKSVKAGTAISGSVPSSVMYQPSFVLTLPL